MKQALIIFAREPIPGTVKTRLARTVGPQAAMELYRAMLGDVLETARSLPDTRLMLFWALQTGVVPDLPEFPGLEMFVQQGADLGERMDNAFSRAFSLGITSCCCIGSDLPDLPAASIRQAFYELESPETDCVFGPAEDGGYYLAGMKRRTAGLFAGIAWSTPQVLEASLDKARELRLATTLLPLWYDIDVMDDLRRLAESPGEAAPRTRRVFSSICTDIREGD